ncbi:lipoprotein [Streptomyces lanatus]|nr:lipoprotein [Streptomyces lanatus]
MRVAATVVVSALTCVLVTGCGGDSAGSDAKALSAAELKKKIIAEGDVDGHEVSATGTKQLPSAKSEINGDEKCKPLVYVVSGLAPGDAATEARTSATEEKKPTDAASKSLEDMSEGDIEDALNESMSRNVTVVGLSSYDGDGAEAAVKSVSEAIENCAGGFSAGQKSDQAKFTEVVSEKGSGTGDESVAFALTSDLEDGATGKVHAEVVRKGNTVATYYTMNLGALMTGKDYTVPTAVIEAQSAKLK